MPYMCSCPAGTSFSATTPVPVFSYTSISWRMPDTSASSRSSPSRTANGSSPTASRAHSTACPSPRASPWRTDDVAGHLGRPPHAREVLRLAPALEQRLELAGAIEVVLDRRLAARGDEDDLLDAGGDALLDDQLDARACRRAAASPSGSPWSRAETASPGPRPGTPPSGPFFVMVRCRAFYARFQPTPEGRERRTAERGRGRRRRRRRRRRQGVNGAEDLGHRLVERRRDLRALGQVAQRARQRHVAEDRDTRLARDRP